MMKNVALILVGLVVGLMIPQKSPEKPPEQPAVAQSQQQTAECTVSRETRPDGSIIDKIDFKAAQAGEQKVQPPVGNSAPGKPTHQFSAFATVPIKAPAEASFVFLYGEKINFLDFDGLKYHVGPGFDTKATLNSVNGGVSYEW